MSPTLYKLHNPVGNDGKQQLEDEHKKKKLEYKWIKLWVKKEVVRSVKMMINRCKKMLTFNWTILLVILMNILEISFPNLIQMRLYVSEKIWKVKKKTRFYFTTLLFLIYGRGYCPEGFRTINCYRPEGTLTRQ